MTWVRSNIKRASWIALLAMVFQLALPFGHCHAIASAGKSAIDVGSATSTHAGNLAAQIADSQSARRSAADQDAGEHPGDICAICVVMAMANTTSLASPPALPSLQAIEFSYPATAGEVARVASTRVAFQPRAPPIS
jgi:hypothetical protein